jgi:membrane-associated phospholipid phosphatase
MKKAAPLPHSTSPSKWRAFLRARFTREGAVGLYMTVGFVACGALVVLFASLADSIVDLHGTTPFDQQVTAAIQEFHTPARDRALRAITFLGGHAFLLPATIVVVTLLFFRGRRVSALLFAGVVVGGLLLETVLKIVYHRARPALWEALVMEKTYSFPSGHATMATLFYGAGAAVVLHVSRRPVVRAAALAFATLAILAVSYSRVYLGAHWTTDVVAGMLIGLFWVVVCATGTEYLARRKPRPPKSQQCPALD